VAEGVAASVDFANHKDFSILLPLKTEEFCSRTEDYVVQAAAPASGRQRLCEMGYPMIAATPIAIRSFL
jgi:hypothetical protein